MSEEGVAVDKQKHELNEVIRAMDEVHVNVNELKDRMQAELNKMMEERIDIDRQRRELDEMVRVLDEKSNALNRKWLELVTGSRARAIRAFFS